MNKNILYFKIVPVKQMTSSNLVLQLKLKCLLKKSRSDDIIEGMEFYIQLSFERFKEQFVLRN